MGRGIASRNAARIVNFTAILEHTSRPSRSLRLLLVSSKRSCPEHNLAHHFLFSRCEPSHNCNSIDYVTSASRSAFCILQFQPPSTTTFTVSYDGDAHQDYIVNDDDLRHQQVYKSVPRSRGLPRVLSSQKSVCFYLFVYAAKRVLIWSVAPFFYSTIRFFFPFLRQLSQRTATFQRVPYGTVQYGYTVLVHSACAVHMCQSVV